MLKNLKIFLCAIMPLLVCSAVSCSETPLNELQAIFEKLKNNNFTVDYTDSFTSNKNIERNQKYYYTEYALQSEGDLGFSALGQKDDVVFRYNLVEDQVVTGAPMVSYNNGMRYTSIYEYTYGLQDFDISALPTTKGSDGYYVYEHDVNVNNDKIFQAVFLKQSYTGINPEQIKIKVIKDVLYIETIILTIDIPGEELRYESVKTVVYDIGKTENKEIKKYLDDGKSYKDPLDLRFFKTINPYFFSHNYTAYFDGTGLGYDFKMTEYCTEDAVLDVTAGGTSSGYIYEQGAVSTFALDGDKLRITGTPMADSDGSFFTSLYGGYIAYTLADLSYDNFVGYKDDENENTYYLTDSELIYILSYICYIELYDENYCDVVKFEILDDETHSFRVSFPLYNKLANKQNGTYVAEFSGLNETKIAQVDRYKNRGANPKTQTKNDLMSVLNEFSNANYSMDSMTGAGFAKIYYNENYFYEELYGNPSNNIGFIKKDDGIFQFQIANNNVVLDKSVDLNDSYNLPGCGDFYFYGNDLGYLSHFDERLYDEKTYELGKVCGMDVWKIKDTDLSKKLFSYVMVDTDVYKNTGVGLLVSKGEDSYDTRLTLIVGYLVSNYGYEGYYTITYYDINNTSYPLLEQYLA